MLLLKQTLFNKGETDMNYVGVDIGGTKCAVVLGNDKGEILSKTKFETTNYEQTFANICNAITAINSDYAAIGISCGGPLNSKTGVIMSPPNLPDWDNVPITKMLGEKFNVTVFLQNDADACALAEWKYGSGKGSDNMIFLTFGTGIGAGLILGGRLYSGTCDCAGEIGHVRMSESGPVGYGKEGSFEGYCSGSGIAQLGIAKARELFQNGKKPSYCKSADRLMEITAKDIADAANNGNEDAISIFKRCGMMLGRGLSVLIDVLNPETIVIGSIFTRCENLLRDEMQKVIEAECVSHSAKCVKVVPAGLGESIGDIAAISVAAVKHAALLTQ